MDCKEIQPVHSEGDQPWDFFGRNDAKAETPVLWPPHAKSWLTGKDSDAGRDWGQEEKGMTEDEMAGWHHWLNGRESGWTPGVGDGQGALACCDSWGRKEWDTTERLNWTERTCIDATNIYWVPICARHSLGTWATLGNRIVPDSCFCGCDILVRDRRLWITRIIKNKCPNMLESDTFIGENRECRKYSSFHQGHEATLILL